jgi:O-antigen/teichoic acid export membrane protein
VTVNLAGRTVTALTWNLGVSAVTAVVLLIRTTLLTRWIAPDHFGTYTLAYAIVAGTSVVANFGLSAAFLHRSPETRDEQAAAATLFTLQAAFCTLWCVLMVASALLFGQGDLRTALLVITPAFYGILLTRTPRMILIRRVVHRRLSMVVLADVVMTTAIALPLAWRGAGLWALLVTDLVRVGVHLTLFYGWRPVWRPRLRWSREANRYFLRFGSRSVLADVTARLLDRLDDLWTGIYLGQTPLGHYSRSYAFARYPGRLLGGPVDKVIGGTYASLKDDRDRLSKAFVRINALLIRAGFFIAGLLFLIMPEFIRLVLTEAWWPMLPAFRLMLLFAMFNPIKRTVADVYVAVGNPGGVVSARIIQLVTLVAGLYLFGTQWGIAGVAVAVDLMLMVGIGYLLWGARRYVDYSLRRLIAVPVLALTAAVALPYVVFLLLGSPENPWISGAAKGLLFSGTFLSVWLSLEWGDTVRMVRSVRRALGREDTQAADAE